MNGRTAPGSRHRDVFCKPQTLAPHAASPLEQPAGHSDPRQAKRRRLGGQAAVARRRHQRPPRPRAPFPAPHSQAITPQPRTPHPRWSRRHSSNPRPPAPGAVVRRLGLIPAHAASAPWRHNSPTDSAEDPRLRVDLLTLACVGKAVRLIEEAAAAGAKVIVFPESFITGYPKGLNYGLVVGARDAVGQEEFRLYLDAAIDVPGPQTQQLGKAAAAHGNYVIV